ncbi:MAG: PilZ domain-containing protein [Pseudomonadota bacterium]|jgi:type IV pilus assembly protein PilZ
MRTPGGSLRNGILNLSLKDVHEIYGSFMPFIEHGGLFVRTHKEYSLGDQVFVLLDLMDEPEKIPLTGDVVWINPAGGSSRPQGIGIRLGAEYAEVAAKLENHLAGMVNADRFNYTL